MGLLPDSSGEIGDDDIEIAGLSVKEYRRMVDILKHIMHLAYASESGRTEVREHGGWEDIKDKDIATMLRYADKMTCKCPLGIDPHDVAESVEDAVYLESYPMLVDGIARLLFCLHNGVSDILPRQFLSGEPTEYMKESHPLFEKFKEAEEEEGE